MRMSDQIPGPTQRNVRRLQRWAKHTPNGQIAFTFIAAGAVLAVIAIIIAIVAL